MLAGQAAEPEATVRYSIAVSGDCKGFGANCQLEPDDEGFIITHRRTQSLWPPAEGREPVKPEILAHDYQCGDLAGKAELLDRA